MNDTKYLYQISLVQVNYKISRSILYATSTYTFAYAILRPTHREKTIISDYSATTTRDPSATVGKGPLT